MNSEWADESLNRSNRSWLFDKAAGAYFSSGWRFLVPYFLFYFGYAAMSWPVLPGAPSAVPCLLHIYWLLHVFHISLLGAWWLRAANRHEPFRLFAIGRIWPLIPWITLAAIIYIPGLYLEWPSDPWEHIRRIAEWRATQNVLEHSNWSKASYFLLYSLSTGITGEASFGALRICYTGLCLLLCWQYRRLAISTGLTPSCASLVPVLAVLLFGNNVFGFFRYYGLSSTIIAHIATIAAVADTLNSWHRLRNWATARQQPTAFLGWILGLACALFVILANHPQGMGIAALGLAAVGIHQLLRSRRTNVLWLLVSCLLVNLASLAWWPRHPVLESVYVPQGWLHGWFGFNLFDTNSPAYDRTIQIVGAAGLINAIAGVWLVRRNHVVGWLTILPPIALSLPAVGIPFANSLADHYTGNSAIITFHRMLFAIPPGLAMVVVGAGAWDWLRQRTSRLASAFAFAALVTAFVALVATPASRPTFNRFWHAVVVVPPDARLAWLQKQTDSIISASASSDRLVTFPGLGFCLNVAGARNVFYLHESRTLTPDSPAASRAALVDRFIAVGPNDSISTTALVIAPTAATTPFSTAALLSGHWNKVEVPLQFSAAREFEETARKSAYEAVPIEGAALYRFDLSPKTVK